VCVCCVCATEIDECMSDPCQNGGTCVDLINGYECRCTDEYTGVNCDRRQYHQDPLIVTQA